MRYGKTDAETCRLNGWAVGTRLVGDEGYGPAVIEITAIGRSGIFAVCHSRNGKPVREGEHTWTLSAREWRVCHD
jgi:hypothetical protein